MGGLVSRLHPARVARALPAPLEIPDKAENRAGTRAGGAAAAVMDAPGPP